MAQHYNPRRAQPAPAKKKRPSGASPTTRRRAKQPVPGWVWLVAGVAVGLFVSLLVKLSSATPTATPVAMPGAKTAEKEKAAQIAAKAEKDKAARQQKAAEKKAPDDAKPATRFDFYTLLPEREVIVPNEAVQQKTAPAGPGQPQTPAEQLFLQAGSFRSPQEADRRRAQILLLGLDARVESVVANGDTWYRVHAGPFTSREKLSKARDQLSAEGIETLLLKQKPG